MSDATTPAVVQDAQQYDWRKDLARLPLMDVSESFSAWSRLAAYVERLEAERDALLAEHEAVGEATRNGVLAIEVEAAHDNAERVIHGEQDS